MQTLTILSNTNSSIIKSHKTMKFNLYNKTIIISGATGGIGSALVRLLIKKYNCTVYGIGRNKEKMQALIDSLDEKSSMFFPVFMDITKRDYSALSSISHADMLINNAGVMPPFTNTLDETVSGFEKVMDCNFFSQIALTEFLLPTLKSSKKGAVCFISSADALCPIAGTGAYGASKSALKAYGETLSSENSGLYVSTVYPGFTKTDLFSDLSFDDGLIASFASTPEKTAKSIAKKLHRGKVRIITGLDARFMNALYKLMPIKGPRLIRKILKKSGKDAFKNI